MKTLVISGFDKANMCPITQEFFELRKKLFVDELGWDIPHDENIENDQYDHLGTTYCIVIDQGKVVGGSRILSTEANHNGWRYMIKDAVDGKIDQIPDHILVDPPVKANKFEITRFTVDPSLSTDYRNQILTELSFSSYQTVAHLGGEYVIALMSPLFLRWFKKIGITVERLGPTVKGEESSYCVIGGHVDADAVARRVA